MTVATAEPAVKWVERRDVPIFDQHVLEVNDPATGRKVLVRVDEERLQRIAKSLNAKYQRSGDECPLVIGHTRDGDPEEKQPPIVGYSSDYYVAPHESDGRPTLFARRWRLYPESQVGGETLTAEDILRRFPRRSPEVWLGRDDIDGISLLGATTPARYLGLVRNSAAESPPASESTTMDLATFLAALQQLIQQAGGGAGAAPAAAPGAMPPAAAPAQYEAKEPCAPGMPEKKEPEKYAAGGVASGTNTFAPSEDVVRMARDQAAIRDRQRDEQDKRRDAEIADLRLKYQRSVRERDLIQLEGEGYLFDRAEELAAVETAPEEQYAAYLKRVRARYQRVAGAGGDFIRTARVTEGGGKPAATSDQAKRAADLALSTKKPYAACLAEVVGGGV